MAWVYILECADGSYYVGSTRDLESRLDQHSSGKGAVHTSKRLPVRLAYAAELDRVVDAWIAERHIHGWGRAKRRALIEGRIDLLKELAKRRGGQARPVPVDGSESG